MTRGIQNAESGPDDRLQVMMRSCPGESGYEADFRLSFVGPRAVP